MPPFNVNDWMYTLADLRPDKNGWFYVPVLVGPRDACYIIEMRQRVADLMSFGSPVEQDLFVLAAGEPKQRLSTKVGGIPYWRADRPWPVNTSGDPIPFLAQFDLRESVDLVPNPPGDVILFFAFTDIRLGATVRVQDQCNADLLIAKHELPVRSDIPTYTGVRWRVEVYPDWAPADGDSWSGLYLDDGSYVFAAPLAMQPPAMQIGNHPYVPPEGKVVGKDERIICTMPGVEPESGEAYPYLNRVAPLTPAEAQDHSIVLSKFDDTGAEGSILYAVETADGFVDIREAC